MQTDNSYLKIARRLDEYRTNKAVKPLQVYATPLPREASQDQGQQTEQQKKRSAPRKPRVSIQEPAKFIIHEPDDERPPSSTGNKEESGIRRFSSRFLEPAAQRIRQSIR